MRPGDLRSHNGTTQRGHCPGSVRRVRGYADYDANQIKHLEMIQAVIARLAQNSSLIKGWALTLSAAFYGFAISEDCSGLALAGLLPTVIFYGLDVYYLQAERLFRVLFEQVRQHDEKVEPFLMGATSPEFRKRMAAAGRDVQWWRTLGRPTLMGFYCALSFAGVVIAIAL